MLILNAGGLQIRPSGNISCRITNADTQCGRITNPPERKKTAKSDNSTIRQFDKCPFRGDSVFRCLISYIIYIL